MKKTSVSLFTLSLVIPVLVGILGNEMQLQVYAMATDEPSPPYSVCAGSNYCVPSITPVVSSANVSSPPVVYSSPGISEIPTVNPCISGRNYRSSNSSDIRHRPHKHKHKHKKKNNGMLSSFMQFLQQLIQMLLTLISSESSGISPTPSVAPSPIVISLVPVESDSQSITDPCISPVQQPSQVPQPSQNAISPIQITPEISSASLPSPVTSKECTSPVWQSSDPNGMWNTAGFFVHNNAWNASNYQVVQTSYACAYNNWYVVANMSDNGDGAVKTYPNVHKDYNNVLLSSFNSISSNYAHVAPPGGNWNFAYDIWINGVGAGNGSTELMIWTEAKGKQDEAIKGYSSAGSVTLSGITYDVHTVGSGAMGTGYIAFDMTTHKSSGTINLKEIFDYIVSKGLIKADSVLGQIDYGVEIVDSGGGPATFKFTDFSITSN